jgi:hypothetical protein
MRRRTKTGRQETYNLQQKIANRVLVSDLPIPDGANKNNADGGASARSRNMPISEYAKARVAFGG